MSVRVFGLGGGAESGIFIDDVLWAMRWSRVLTSTALRWPVMICVMDRRARYPRVTARPEQMGGVPCIRGLRIPVATVVDMVADGMDHDEILAAYPDLEVEDVREAVRFAAEAVRERELPLIAPG